MKQSLHDESYWENLYISGQAAWDIGTVSSPLKQYIDQYKNKNARILIPGCGNAYEAAHLIEQGFTNITLIDIAPAAIELVRNRLKEFEGRQLHLICGDFFDLEQQFDLVIEQTFFCALAPQLRNAYCNKMADILSAEAKLAGVLFNRHFEVSPPYGGCKEEYYALFDDKFNVMIMEECYNSIDKRAGTELFFILQKKDDPVNTQKQQL